MPEARMEGIEAAAVSPTDKQRAGFRFRGWAGVFFLGPLAVVALFSRPSLPASDVLDLVFALAAPLLFLSGAFLRYWATLYLGGRKREEMILDGPYSVCRNPLYIGSFLLALSGAAYARCLTLGLGVGLLSLVYVLGAVPVEESYLREKLGGAYARYVASVPRWIPDFRLHRSPETIEVTLHGLRNETARAMRWALVPAAGLGFAYLRSRPWWPHFLTLP